MRARSRASFRNRQEAQATPSDPASDQTWQRWRDRLLGLTQSVAAVAGEIRLNLRASVEQLDWADRWIAPTAQKARSIGLIASDVADYAASRIRSTPREPSEHLARALNRIVTDSAHSLIEVRKDLAVCMADRRRLLRAAELATTEASVWTRAATGAAEEGNHERSRDAMEQAEAHERIARHAHLEADKLEPRLNMLRHDLRSFEEMLEKTQLTLDGLRASEVSQRALARAVQQMRRLQEVASQLATLAASAEGALQRDEPACHIPR